MHPPRKPFARLAIVAALVTSCLLGTDARAEPTVVRKSAQRRRPHAVYLELLGKGGLWGVGYDLQLGGRFGVGGTVSYTVLDDQRLFTVSPYLAAYPLGGRRHRWFVHAGPQLVHLSTPSPVPEWSGTSSTGVGVEVSTGYEYRARLLVRTFVMGVAGQGGVAPWLGVSIGWAF